MPTHKPFTFEISLSVLNHLGRHLYRSFATVLGEAISNAWDADAQNVWIYIDQNKKGLWIKDDGTGMNADDFQNKFLRIGYTKRKVRKLSAKRKRPYIGRKGIGKLALLSCADQISVISKIPGGEYIGGKIDNPDLDEAITDDLTPQEYPLSAVNVAAFANYTKGHTQGTIIRFANLKEGVKRSFEFLSTTIALYFRFSLLDKSFKMFLNDEQITHKNLGKLVDKTQFLWKVGEFADPFVQAVDKAFSKDEGKHETKNLSFASVTGFIASVELPRDLKVMTTDERVGIDLFVNGRLRERDVLKHIPTARIVENYLYGQLHFNGLDDATDRFTSSREGIVADDPKYQEFLETFRKKLSTVIEDWDKWRRKHREEGDPENESLSKSERASLNLYNVVTKEFTPPKGSKNAGKVEAWVDELSTDATFNFGSYAECFISENLIRKFIVDKSIALSAQAKAQAQQYREREVESKSKGNISIKVRSDPGDLSYLDMTNLANLVDKRDPIKEACLARDATEFKPMRDAVAHTALLTNPAKARLTATRENIKARVKELLGEKP